MILIYYIVQGQNVYSIYIWLTNLSFGLLSTLAPSWLLTRSPLAGAVSGFICVYWVSRFFIQIFYFDRSAAPGGIIFKLAEASLTLLFIYLSVIYGAAAYFNLSS